MICNQSASNRLIHWLTSWLNNHSGVRRLADGTAVTHGGAVGRAWRGGGPRRALLGRLLAGIDVRPFDDRLGRAAGGLLARAGVSDVIDTALVLLAHDGDEIATSETDDLIPLAELTGSHIEPIRV